MTGLLRLGTDVRHPSKKQHCRNVIRRAAVATCLMFGLVAQAGSQPMTTRDILYLKDYGQKVESVSWCNDNVLTFVDRAQRWLPPADARSSGDQVKKLSLVTKRAMPLLVYPDGIQNAQCVRDGQYLYASGRVYAARPLGSPGGAEPGWPGSVPFTHLVDISGGKRGVVVPQTSQLLYGPVFTSPDGHVFGHAHGKVSVDLGSMQESKRVEFLRSGGTYSVTNGPFGFVVFGLEYPRPQLPFRVYGLQAPEIVNLGSYSCPAPLPGCAPDSVTRDVAYYAFAKVNTPGSRANVVFSVVPEKGPLVQRWPVVSVPGAQQPGLVINNVAMDERRCLVLLQLDPELKSSRTDGRLRVDLYIADCRFANGRFEVGEPRRVARKQGSFNYARVTLHGDFSVITETTDRSAQPEDQIEFERDQAGRERICAHFLHGKSAASLQRRNALCVRLGHAYNEFNISNEASFIAIRSDETPLIIGRDYRNDGTGPLWLDNGE